MLKQLSAADDARSAQAIYMDTLVSIDVSGAAVDRDDRIAQAFGWFEEMERVCSRFDPASELSRLSSSRLGTPVAVSSLLFEALDFALSVAAESGGAFDPAVGYTMQRRGYDRNYRSGARIDTDGEEGNFGDVHLNRDDLTVTLSRRLVLDLGAVAKGFAIDLAAEELRPLGDFAINAGGDIFASGRNYAGEPWRIGIRNPRRHEELINTLAITDSAVCTSGDYERPIHILDARTSEAAAVAASVTVVAPWAILADALSTAAFAMGPERGLAFLEQQGVDGLIITPGLRTLETKGFGQHRL